MGPSELRAALGDFIVTPGVRLGHLRCVCSLLIAPILSANSINTKTGVITQARWVDEKRDVQKIQSDKGNNENEEHDPLGSADSVAVFVFTSAPTSTRHTSARRR